MSPAESFAAALRRQLVDDLFFGDEEQILRDDDDLFELGLDSLGVHRLVVFIERELRVKLPDSAIVGEHFRTLAALVECCLEHRR